MWSAVGASVTGASHRARGDGCDDANRWEIVDGTLVLAVADGAGSAPRGGEGAAAAVRAAVDAVVAVVASGACTDPEQLVAGAMVAARVAVEGAAAVVGAPLRDLATTLAVVVASPDWTASAQVGDVAVVAAADDDLTVVGAGARGEYLNETEFVTGNRWATDVRLDVSPPATAIAAMTDGLQMVAFDLATGVPHRPFFTPLFDYVAGGEADCEELSAFLGSPRVAERTDDDVTLVVAAAPRG